MNKYTSNSSKGCLKLILKIQKNFKNYPLAPDKIEIKQERLSEYQLKIADLYNISTGNVKKLISNFFNKEKDVLHYENLQVYSRLGLKLKKHIAYLEFNQSQWLKTIY